MSRNLATAAALALVWPAWWLGGVVLEAVSLDALDLLGRLGAVCLVLGLAERVFARLPANGEGDDHG